MNELAKPAGSDATDDLTSRRSFLSHIYVFAALSSFMGIIVGVPILGYITNPLQIKQQPGKWVPLGKAADFAADSKPQVVQFTITGQDGWIEVNKAATCWVVPNGDHLTVFNGRCTHLGCAYSWETEGDHANEFHCPCHDGAFNREGQVMGGPPPRPLDKLQTRVVNGDLQVFYQDFRLGVPKQQPL